MKYIKYGFSAFTKYLSTNIIIILQLIFLFTALNVIIGNYNSRDILYSPYKSILKNKGYAFYTDYESEMYDPQTGEYLRSFDDCFKETESKLIGEYNSYVIYSAEIADDVQSQKRLKLIFIDDRIYDNLELPLVSGKWENKENEIYGIISNNTHNLGTGSSVYIGDSKITISGELTDPTYIPSFTLWIYNLCVTDFYSAEYSKTSQYDYLLLKLSSLESIKNTNALVGNGYDGMVLIEFSDDISNEDMELNKEILNSSGENVTLTSFDDIKNRSDVYENVEYNKTKPIILLVWIITLSGVICSSAIITVKSLRDYTIFYICGSKWSQCLLISFINSAISVFISMGIAMGLIQIGLLNGFSEDIGFVIKENNILITLIVAVITLSLSIIMPLIIFKTKQPKDIINSYNI